VGNFSLKIFNSRWAVIWKNLIMRIWAFIASWIIGLKIQVQGPKPDCPFLLVSNHLSYIDPLLFWRYLDATFVAKSEIKSWPFFGWGAREAGVLFINRELRKDVHRMNECISECISEDQGVILFPEGTSTKGDEVQPFNAPLLQYSIDANLPVHYAAISYKAPLPWKTHLDVCWWGEMSFFSHFWKLLKMPEFKAIITFGNKTISAQDRKILAEKLQKAVADQFTPVRSKSYHDYRRY